MTKAELGQAERIVEALVAPRLEEPAPGRAFCAFFLEGQATELEPDEVLERFKKGRGVYVTELVWDARLELNERGDGRVVRTLDDLRQLLDRTQQVQDGMEQLDRARPPAGGAPTVHTVVRTGDLSWSTDVEK